MRYRRHVAIYGRLLAVYPKGFRKDYGPDLVALFVAQLNDEPPARVWLRTVRDLAVSVPTQHLEAHVTRPSGHAVPLLFALVATTAMIGAVVVGTAPALPVLLVVAALAAAAAVWSLQAATTATGVRSLWWRFLLAAPAVAVVTLAGMAIPWPDAIDLGDNAYWLVFFAFTVSLGLAAVGLVLGAEALVRRSRA